MLATPLPPMAVWPAPVPLAVQRRATREDEVDDIAALLREHADAGAGSEATLAWLAETVAVGCLGDDHLWQDLQLPSRAALSALFAHWFPRLAARNDRDMKWKKFLYKQLCEREALFICKAPSCAVCSDHALCFGPEEPAKC